MRSGQKRNRSGIHCGNGVARPKGFEPLTF